MYMYQKVWPSAVKVVLILAASRKNVGATRRPKPRHWQSVMHCFSGHVLTHSYTAHARAAEIELPESSSQNSFQQWQKQYSKFQPLGIKCAIAAHLIATKKVSLNLLVLNASFHTSKDCSRPTLPAICSSKHWFYRSGKRSLKAVCKLAISSSRWAAVGDTKRE